MVKQHRLRRWGILAIIIVSVCLPINGQDYEYDEVLDPALQIGMESMRAHQLQYTMFLFYTINIDTPGFVEIGGYNVRTKEGKIKMIPFYRWRSGPIEETNEILDFYLDANSRGMFVIHMPNNGIGFTRNGRFRIDSSNRLVTWQNSFPIMNVENNGFIYIPQGSDITVSKSGVVYADGEPVGKIRVGVFTNDGLSKLVTINGAIFVSADGQMPEILPGGERTYGVHQGFLERNNVLKSIVGDVGLLKRSYTSTAKASQVVTRVMNSAIQLGQP